ncbi:hypothetical protein FJV20_19080 [Acinetobacter baumannii]|uniref:hypothetical protein n=1 Tax=Acinetobacter baumannii TaxID=470 RepID=UPI00112A9D84|nr:hypothetical protein [Acinetobacter baumannii]TPV19120.1 hypothetical protein FJV20_19080 [Acinetobacter baumannii]
MDNYKIINTHTNEIIKALNDLGYVWTPKKFDERDCLLKAHWILAKEKGEIAYSSGTHIDSPLVFTELTLPQLRDLVVLKRNNVNDANYRSKSVLDGFYFKSCDGFFYFMFEGKWVRSTTNTDEGLEPITQPQDPALISGDVALANVHKCTVQYLHDDEPYGRWTTITDHLWSQYHLGMFLDPDTKFKFRFKPQTIKLELELPKPFEPEEGEKYWWINPNAKLGYEWDTNDLERTDFNRIAMSVWRTEEEIKQVVEQLRKIRGTNS